MPTVGDILLKSMKETKPGIKGTESETLGDWLLTKKAEKEKAPWYSFFKPTATVMALGAMAGQTLGNWLLPGKKKPPAVQEWEKSGLEARGYTEEDIDRGLAGDIKVDIAKILQDRGIGISPADMAKALKELKYSDEDIRKVGVKF